MGRVYAVDDRGEKFLRMIECDEPGCTNVLVPGPDVARSGWAKCGYWSVVAGWLDSYYCEQHARRCDRAP